jgi:uncharacterized protein
MRLGDAPESSNFEDRTGQSGGGMSLGGGAMGLIFSLVASRFGIVGILVLALGYCALSSLGGGGGILGGGGGSSSGESRLSPEQRQVLTRVLGSTEQIWGQIFQQAGAQYQPTRLVAYTDYNQSGCGAAQAAMGPFYCPTDKQIYIDPAFFEELSRRFQAPGDFAQAYVIAHEVGHHVQNQLGILEKAQGAQQSAGGRAQANRIQVRVELQADCFGGVWANNAEKKHSFLEPGDVDAALQTASAIGDDTLQRRTEGRVVPDSFTHGSAEQRKRWFMTGFTQGKLSACNTFTAERP